MANHLPDLARIRRNWERAEAEPNMRDPGPDRLSHVRAPLDPFVVARPLLERLRRELGAEFPEQRAVLEPFIARVEQRFERMQQRAPSGGAQTEPSSPAALEQRAQFVTALNDLEDLCEALLHTKR